MRFFLEPSMSGAPLRRVALAVLGVICLQFGCTTSPSIPTSAVGSDTGAAAEPAIEPSSPPASPGDAKATLMYAKRGPLPEGLDGIAVKLNESTPSEMSAVIQKIGLADILDEALSGNIDLALARAEEEIAKRRVQTADGRFYPRLELGGGASNTDGRVQASFGNLRDVNFNTFDPGGAVTYDLNLGAEIYRAMAVRRELDEALYERLSVEQRLLVRVTELYQDLVLGKVGVQIASAQVADSERVAGIARSRFAASLGTETDVARAEASLALVRQQRVVLRNIWENASIRLAVVLRRLPSVLLEPAEETLAPRGLAPADAAWRPEMEARRRPDVESARFALAAADQRASEAWWNLLGPAIRAEVRETFIGDQIHDLNDRFDHGVFVQWEFSVDGFGRVKESQAEKDAAGLRLAQVEDRAIGEVASARREIRAAADRIPLANDGLEAAQTSLRLSLARFEAGTAILLEVLEAQDSIARARLNLARAIAAFNVAQVRLLAAAGRIQRDALLP